MTYNASVGMQLVYSNRRHVKNKARAYNTVCCLCCVCLPANISFVYDSDHRFSPIVLKFGSWVTHMIAKTIVDGQ